MSTLIKPTLLALACGLIYAPLSHADEGTAEGVLPTIVVTGSKSQQTVKDSPASVVVITRQQIEKSGVNTVDQLLTTVAGVYASRMSESNVNRISQTYSRGLPGARTLVLVDGMPLNVLYDGQVDWGQVTTQDIEQVEVIRGGASALYGNNAMGAVINIVAKKPTEGRSGHITVEAGSMDTQRYLGSFQNKIGAHGFSVSGYYASSDGYNMFAPASRTAQTTATGLKKSSLNAKYTYDINEYSTLNAGLSYLKDKMTGFYNVEGYNPQSREQVVTHLGHEYAKGALKVTTNLYARLGNQTTNSTNATNTEIASNADYDDKTYGLSSHLNWTLSNQHKITTGIDLSKGSVHNEYRYVATPARINDLDGKVNRYGVFIQDEFRPNDKFIITVGGRYDHWRTNGSLADVAGKPQGVYASRTESAFSPKLGLVYKITPELSLRSSWSKSFNTPDMTQLYQSTKRGTATYEGNPDLKPETLTGGDIGLDYYFSKNGYVRATYYQNKAKNFIYNVKQTPTSFKKVNVGGVDINGVELEASYRFSPLLKISASYTYNNSEISEYNTDATMVGKKLTVVPKNQASIELTSNLPHKFTVGVRVNHVGDRFGDDQNTAVYESYTTGSVFVSKELANDFSVKLVVDNVANVEYQGNSYVSPGRVVTLQLKKKF